MTGDWWHAPGMLPGLHEVLRYANRARDHRGRVEPDGAGRLEDLLGGPARRLAVYGTLAPGEENHHVIAPAGGTWRAVEIEGSMGRWGPYPVFEWTTPGVRIPAMLVESATLAEHWARLDEFETDYYARYLVPCIDGELVRVTNCYVRAARS